MIDSVRHLYIHIPFCPSKCGYCAFETHVGSLRLVPQYLAALARELENDVARCDRARVPLRTVYFGGGTPSMLTAEQIEAVIADVQGLIGIDQDAEITVECHPSTVDRSRLTGYRSAGVTRVSFGVESLDGAELGAVGRAYAPEQALHAIDQARQAGLTDIAADLIYGLPGQTLGSWESTLNAAVAADLDHLSLYPLAIEPRTVFARRQRENRLSLPRDETVVDMYALACHVLAGAGLEHYEVASWARPGHRCRHNLAYWQNREFFGVGVGAHAYLKPERTENIRGTARYARAIASGGSVIAHREPMERDIELAETIMLRLRLLVDGVDMVEVGNRFDCDLQSMYARDLADLQQRDLLHISGNVIRIPESAVPLANEVWQIFVGL
jgi:oxygen-independent coproporphyrinogen-3 oxidase